MTEFVKNRYYSQPKCAFTAHLRLDKLSLLLDFAHREAILNGKIRYFHRQNGCE